MIERALAKLEKLNEDSLIESSPEKEGMYTASVVYNSNFLGEEDKAINYLETYKHFIFERRAAKMIDFDYVRTRWGCHEVEEPWNNMYIIIYVIPKEVEDD